MKKTSVKDRQAAETLPADDTVTSTGRDVLEGKQPTGQATDTGAGNQTSGKKDGSGAEPSDSPDEMKGKIDSLEDALLRAKADFQNLLRRSAAQRSEAVRFANAELMRSLVAVADDFERSLTAAREPGNHESVVDGVRLVYENLMKALRDHGLEPIDALDQPFDPHVHQAMLQQPCADKPPGTVLEEVAKGYKLRDRVIRPAKVVVSKAVEGPRATEEAAGRTNDSREEERERGKTA